MVNLEGCVRFWRNAAMTAMALTGHSNQKLQFCAFRPIIYSVVCRFWKLVIILGRLSLLLRQKQTLWLVDEALWRLRQVVEFFAQRPPQLPLTKSYFQACTFRSAAHWAD